MFDSLVKVYHLYTFANSFAPFSIFTRFYYNSKADCNNCTVAVGYLLQKSGSHQSPRLLSTVTFSPNYMVATRLEVVEFSGKTRRKQPSLSPRSTPSKAIFQGLNESVHQTENRILSSSWYNGSTDESSEQARVCCSRPPPTSPHQKTCRQLNTGASPT